MTIIQRREDGEAHTYGGQEFCPTSPNQSIDCEARAQIRSCRIEDQSSQHCYKFSELSNHFLDMSNN